MTTTSIQQTYPARASWRTAVQNVLSVILVLGIVAPIVAAILHDELGEYLPDAWLAWVVAAAAVLAAVAAALARIMAIPAVDAWLRHLGLSSTPTRAPIGPDGVPVITTTASSTIGAIDAAKIRANAIDSGKIAANAVTAARVTAGAIVDTAAPAGYEVTEVSAAKDEVAEAVRDLLEYHLDDVGAVYATPRDPIHEADVIVEKLLALGWRPTA